MRRRVYETVERPSVRLSHRSTAAAACGGFAAERPQEISIDSGGRRVPSSNGAAARSRIAAFASKCGQCHVDS